MKPQTRIAAAAGGILSVTALFGVAVGMTTGASAAVSPLPLAPGNNGDFQIDGPPYDPDHKPSNESHVDGCELAIDFFNYDANQVALVAFTDSAPTSDGGVVAAGQPAVLLGQPSGRNSYNGSSPYTLSFIGAPHPQQGFHVRVSVTVDGQSKYKEFFVEGCSSTPPTTTVTTATTSTTTTTTGATTGTTTDPGATTDITTTTATTGATTGTTTDPGATTDITTTTATGATTGTTTELATTDIATTATSGGTASTSADTTHPPLTTGSSGAVDPPAGESPAIDPSASTDPFADPSAGDNLSDPSILADSSTGGAPVVDPPTAVEAGLPGTSAPSAQPSSDDAPGRSALLGVSSGVALAGAGTVTLLRRRTRGTP